MENHKIKSRYIVVCLYLAVLILAWGCASKQRMLSFVTLPPPDGVRAEVVENHIKIYWRPPQLEPAVAISAYAVYLSSISLIYTAVSDLPEPVAKLATSQMNVQIPKPKDRQKLFLHMRSADKDGLLSLPSLPEIILELQ